MECGGGRARANMRRTVAQQWQHARWRASFKKAYCSWISYEVQSARCPCGWLLARQAAAQPFLQQLISYNKCVQESIGYENDANTFEQWPWCWSSSCLLFPFNLHLQAIYIYDHEQLLFWNYYYFTLYPHCYSSILNYLFRFFPSSSLFLFLYPCVLFLFLVLFHTL